MENKVCVKINCYKGFSYDETLDGVKNAGYKYVELSTSKGNSLNLRQDSSLEEIEKLKNDLTTRGLSAIAIGGNSYLLDDDTSKILANIKLAKYFGCKYLDTTMFNAHAESGVSFAEDEVIKHINFYVPYLEENDLDLVIELHGNYASGKILRPILDKVNSKHVHINFDTGNALYWGKLSVEEMVEDFKESVDYVSFMHLKDKLGKIDDWNFPALGSGYIPFKEIVAYLNNKNNSSTLTVEIEFTPEGVKDVKEVDKALIDSYNFLSSLGLSI